MNTCCGNPRPGESLEHAAQRRLKEEMGFESELTELFAFIYRADLEEGLVETEYDHVLLGRFEGVPDPAEVAACEWLDLATLSVNLTERPQNYTYWFRISFERFLRAAATLRPTAVAGPTGLVVNT